MSKGIDRKKESKKKPALNLMQKRAAKAEKGEGRQEKVDISARTDTDHASITREADKGYDFLFVGLRQMRDGEKKFSGAVDQAVSGFSGPLALVVAGRNFDASRGLRVLVPIDGTTASRRGAEIAFALSSAHESAVTVLYTSELSGDASEKRRSRRSSARRSTERAVLDDALATAERYGHEEVKTAIHSETVPEDAILAEAEFANANLIVIGADRRVGNALYLGRTIEAVASDVRPKAGQGEQWLMRRAGRESAGHQQHRLAGREPHRRLPHLVSPTSLRDATVPVS